VFGARVVGEGFKKVETGKSYSFLVFKIIFHYVESKKQFLSRAESVIGNNYYGSLCPLNLSVARPMLSLSRLQAQFWIYMTLLELSD